jgi:DNA-directed RNA polymerase subunit K/omega
MENQEFTTVDHTQLLHIQPNKYELVLQVARKAKVLKDEMARIPGPEPMKPIPLAITQMLTEAEAEADHQAQ